MALDPTDDTAKRIYPIPKPKKLPDRIHHCSKSSSTLQRQMRFESDPKTFSALTKIIRKTASSYTDLTLPYKWQDPQTLDDIKDDVLQQCPTLKEMYVDSWPVYSYLQLAMKQQGLGYGYKMVPGSSANTASTKSSGSSKQVTTEPEQTPSTSTAVATSRNPPVGKPVGRQLSWTSSLPRSTTATESSKYMSAPTKAPDNAHEDQEGEDEGEDEEEVDELVDELDKISSSRSEKLADPTYQDPGNASEGSSTEEEEGSLSQWPKGPIGSVFYTPYQGRTPSIGPDLSEKPTMLTTGGTDITATETTQPSPAPDGIRAPAYTSQSSVSLIENMLLERGLPLADAQRINQLFASLGIMDETHLRVFARLATSRKAWLSEMHEKEELTEIQASVVVDMLDTVMVD
ncbi:hypothetical protein TRAPUB_11469 [Trametes pubescens]|uniref:Uncharacterized protein n=1 Tax=Trametes pubescens TaxID=154538 RepID=A0A1M2VWS3_TRAPU|nr:hypothetical protein TRAPUB_11469 [Trametes pubescens]